MKKALVIFNGIQFHYYHIDRAFEWAMQNNAELHGVFVHSKKEPPEGYIFPSDIDPAENLYNKSDAERANERVIMSQIKLFADIAKSKNIPANSEEIADPSLKRILGLTEEAEILFIDAEYNKASLLPCRSFNWHHLIKDSNCPVELVYEKSQKN